jgi:hypothetical protein
MMLRNIKVILVDDHQLFAEGVAAMFSSHDFIQIVAKVSSAQETLSQITKYSPDLILLDIKMPGFDGIDLLREIREKMSGIKIIMLTTYSDFHTINTCKQLGANGYILKNTTFEELETVIVLVMSGEFHFPSFFESEDQEFSKFSYYSKQFKITKREWNLLQLVKQAKTNLQISEDLQLSIYTVETHRKNIMQKLGLKSTGSLIRFIHENGI